MKDKRPNLRELPPLDISILEDDNRENLRGSSKFSACPLVAHTAGTTIPCGLMANATDEESVFVRNFHARGHEIYLEGSLENLSVRYPLCYFCPRCSPKRGGSVSPRFIKWSVFGFLTSLPLIFMSIFNVIRSNRLDICLLPRGACFRMAPRILGILSKFIELDIARSIISSKGPDLSASLLSEESVRQLIIASDIRQRFLTKDSNDVSRYYLDMMNLQLFMISPLISVSWNSTTFARIALRPTVVGLQSNNLVKN